MLAMKTLLIVFHSFTGGTRQMAEAATRGAGAKRKWTCGYYRHRTPGLQTRWRRAPRRGSIETGRSYAGVQVTAGNGRNPAVPSIQTLRIQPRVPKTPHRYSAVLDRRP